MILALEARKDLQIHVFHDERSAAFAALGIAISSGVPVIVLCTSGTAAAEFFPAVAESAQACVPLIVCTADRPPELQGVGAPQTMDQQNMYGRYVRHFLNVAPPTIESSGNWRKTAREVWSGAVSADPGPVHLNLQFREPLVGSPGELPPLLPAQSPIATAVQEDLGDLQRLLGVSEGLILAGAGIDDPSAVTTLGERLGWPVAADPRSGCRTDSSVFVHLDSILRHQPTAERLTPKVILRFGAPPVSKVVNQWVASSGAEVVSISPLRRRIDPERVVTRHIIARASDVAASLKGNRPDRTWRENWKRCEDAARSALVAVFDSQTTVTEPWLAREVSASVADDEILLLSSSMPVRDVEWFAERCPRTVVANRGVNGIDGVSSTAIGLALGSGRPVTVLIGDLAFLHDSNALINFSDRPIDLRLVVIDNSGGGIFSFLEQAKSLDKPTFERFFGTPHRTDLVALARAHGVSAVSAESKEAVIQELYSRASKVLVVRTNREENVAAHDRLNRAVAERLAGLPTVG